MASDYLGVKCYTIMRWIEQRGMPAFSRWENLAFQNCGYQRMELKG
jgi:hypothetical protein